MTDDLNASRVIYRKFGRAPVPAEGGGSMKGVTVREIGQSRNPILRAATTTNMLLRCAQWDDRDLAATALMEVLGITDTAVCVANLSDPERWRKLPVENRLDEIGHWLRAECFQCMDLIAFDKPAGMTFGD